MFKILISLLTIAVMISTVYAQPPTLIWDDTIGTNDLSLSKDGNYVAIASGKEVRYYHRSSGTPLWIKQLGTGPFVVLSVAISADGDCVAAGTSHPGGGEVFFWNSARTRTTSTADPTWSSVNLGGSIDYRSLDISDDGNYIAASGGGKVFYWANAKTKSGSDVGSSWNYDFTGAEGPIDLSSDGDYLAAACRCQEVAYWKNIRFLSGTQNPDWISTEPDNDVVDVAISDNGEYVAAATQMDASVHYWANAKTLTGDPSSKWWGGQDVSFTSIDISSNGDSVIAGSEAPTPQVYFWSGAQTLTGKPQSPTWTHTTDNGIHDVAISSSGDFMVAAQSIAIPHTVFFFDQGGSLKWSFELDESSHVVAISSTGDTVAVGTQAPTTAYLLDTGYSSFAPVGGVASPVNKFAVLTPYVALAGLIIAVSAIVIKKRK